MTEKYRARCRSAYTLGVVDSVSLLPAVTVTSVRFCRFSSRAENTANVPFVAALAAFLARINEQQPVAGAQIGINADDDDRRCAAVMSCGSVTCGCNLFQATCAVKSAVVSNVCGSSSCFCGRLCTCVAAEWVLMRAWSRCRPV